MALKHQWPTPRVAKELNLCGRGWGWTGWTRSQNAANAQQMLALFDLSFLKETVLSWKAGALIYTFWVFLRSQRDVITLTDTLVSGFAQEPPVALKTKSGSGVWHQRLATALWPVENCLIFLSLGFFTCKMNYPLQGSWGFRWSASHRIRPWKLLALIIAYLEHSVSIEIWPSNSLVSPFPAYTPSDLLFFPDFCV